MGEKSERGTPQRFGRCRSNRVRVLLVLGVVVIATWGCVTFLMRLLVSRGFDQKMRRPDLAVAAAAARGAHAVLDALARPDVPIHVVIDARYGLGNRMRTVASGMAVAAASNRPLLVVWVPDAHANCSIHRLFAGPLPFAVLESELPMAWLPRDRFQAYNYMPGEAGSVKREWVRLDHRRHLFVRSAYRVAHERGDWAYTMRKMRQLRPRASVRQRLVADSSMIGLHVRGVVDAISDYGANGSAALAEWRERSTWPRFVDRMRAEPPDRSFYLAADSPAAYEGLKAAFPGRIRHAERSERCTRPGARCDLDRGCEGMEAALVDVLNLARTQRILGSFYSSFSEVARYYGTSDVFGSELPFEAAGIDFF